MRRHLAVLALLIAASSLTLLAQAESDQTASQNDSAAVQPAAAPAAPAQAAPAAPAQAAARATAPVHAAAPAAPAQAGAAKLDALLLYRQGRDLETAGRQADAQAKYTQSIAVCDKEIQADSKRIESYVVKCWSLFRLNRHDDVVATGQAGLKVSFDPRISEAMGESYYFLGQMDSSIKFLQRYLDAAGDSGDRGPTALFFMGEAYLRLKKYSHADIAYSTAVAKEPTMPRWWFRLGNACESLGEWKRAFDAYGKAVALNPSYQEASAAQARVKSKVSP
jgi:tetratricopeptide (TPR) repeat protein